MSASNKRVPDTDYIIKKVSSSGKAGRYEIESSVPVDASKVPVAY